MKYKSVSFRGSCHIKFNHGTVEIVADSSEIQFEKCSVAQSSITIWIDCPRAWARKYLSRESLDTIFKSIEKTGGFDGTLLDGDKIKIRIEGGTMIEIKNDSPRVSLTRREKEFLKIFKDQAGPNGLMPLDAALDLADKREILGLIKKRFISYQVCSDVIGLTAAGESVIL